MLIKGNFNPKLSPNPRYLIAHTIDKTRNEGINKDRDQIFKSIDFNFLFWTILTVLLYLGISVLFIYLLSARKNLRSIIQCLLDENSPYPMDRYIWFGVTAFLFLAFSLLGNCIKTTKGKFYFNRFNYNYLLLGNPINLIVLIVLYLKSGGGRG